MIQLTDAFCVLFKYNWPTIYDYYKRQILLSVIQLYGWHCNLKRVQGHSLMTSFEVFNDVPRMWRPSWMIPQEKFNLKRNEKKCCSFTANEKIFGEYNNFFFKHFYFNLPLNLKNMLIFCQIWSIWIHKKRWSIRMNYYNCICFLTFLHICMGFNTMLQVKRFDL